MRRRSTRTQPIRWLTISFTCIVNHRHRFVRKQDHDPGKQHQLSGLCKHRWPQIRDESRYFEYEYGVGSRLSFCGEIDRTEGWQRQDSARSRVNSKRQSGNDKTKERCSCTVLIKAQNRLTPVEKNPEKNISFCGFQVVMSHYKLFLSEDPEDLL